MAIELVISGGQLGADQAGLRAARTAGIMTGGTAPRGSLAEVADVSTRWMTRPWPWLAFLDLVECEEEGFPAGTRAKVRDADATVWLGSILSRGLLTTTIGMNIRIAPKAKPA